MVFATRATNEREARGPDARGATVNRMKCALDVALTACMALVLMGSVLMCAERAWAIEAPAGVPTTVEGECHIGDSWRVDDTTLFTVPFFDGLLEGAMPSSTFRCLNPTAAAPTDMDATYEAELVAYSYEEGWVEYYVSITPPGVTDGVTYNELGLVGYQRVGGTVRKAWDFCGAIELVKASALPGITDGNRCYSLAGASYGIFESQQDAATHDRSRALRVMETDGSGSCRTALDLPKATYYVAETQASSGYARDDSVYAVAVEPGKTVRVNAERGSVPEVPASNPVTLWAHKDDAETPDGTAQGDATLAGARFLISFYDGYYDAGSLPASPTRSWIVETGEDGNAWADDSHRVGGDEYYRMASGQVTIPLGTVTVSEIGAPSGYLIGNGSDNAGGMRLFKITQAGGVELVNQYQAPTVVDYVKRGGVAIGKVDRQNGAYAPQGSATLEGARFAIENASAHPVVVEGVLYEAGEVVKTIETQLDGDGRYVARTGADCLPVGTYALRETATSTGYFFDEAARQWESTFRITENGSTVDLTDPASACPNVVVRGDWSLSKVDGQTMDRLGMVPFLITSQTTGEWHVVVTDENGMVSTASSWNGHTDKTNANDAAYVAGSNAAGVGNGDAAATAGGDAPAADDGNANGNNGDAATGDATGASGADGGNVHGDGSGSKPAADDADSPAADGANAPAANSPDAAPAANSPDAPAANDDASAAGGGDAATTSNEGAPAASGGDSAGGGGSGSEPAIREELLDPTAGVWFSGRTDLACAPDDALGALPYDTYTVTELRCKANEGLELVSFEVTISRNARELDLGTIDDNMGPYLNTSLANGEGAKLAPDGQTVQLTDTVRYENLDKRANYTVRGSLHVVNDDGTDGGVVAESSNAFQPNATSGTVDVGFTLDTNGLSGKRVVAFEELVDDRGETVATHADLAFEGQTIRVPSIGTTLVDAEDGDHAVNPLETVKLVDTVRYQGLKPGANYTVTGTLHLRNADGSDGGAATDADGNPIRGYANFTAAESSGSVEVEFTFAAADMADKEVVAFEELSHRGVVYATHADISDEGQTVKFGPKTPEEETKPSPQKDGADSAKKGGNVPKTGDDVPVAAIVVIVFSLLGAAGMVAATLISRHEREGEDIVIHRGQSRY